ncbi:MAG: LysR family transcriptional regulator [Burkholderiales bacterium]|nr:LysR family transcriptional regulator [Burkholderiales bacterium]
MAGVASFLAFAETVKRGSFAAAARELGLSPSAVAKGVARLEADLGLRLLHRTTRQVRLTGEGSALYQRCARIVEDIDALREEAEGSRGAPRGQLRVNMPLTYGRRVVLPRLVALQARHPELTLELSFSDRQVDLIREGLDAVVRIGRLADSSLVARRIGTQQLQILASPDYLRRHGAPRDPEALSGHRCIVFRLPTTGRVRAWELRQGRRAITLTPPAPVVVDDGEALVAAARMGAGLVQAPDNLAHDAVAAGALVEVLAGFRPAPMPISLVYPAARHVTPRLRALIDALARTDA